MVNGTSNRSSLSTLLAQASPEARLAIVACDDANKSREAASRERALAHKDRLQALRKGAQKLREMAGNVLLSSIYQGALGAAATIAGYAGKDAEKLANGATDAAKRTELLGKANTRNAMAGGFQVLAEVDPFAISNKYLEHDRAMLDIEGEAASHRSTQASDDLAHAREMHSNVVGTLKQIEEAKHRAMLETTKI